MLQLLKTFQGFGYQVTFGSTAIKTSYTHDLEAMGVKSVNIALNHSSFDEFIKELHPDVVVFDRFMIEEQFGWRVAEFAPQALRILDTEDLHALRKAREEAHKKRIPFSLEQWKNHPMALREVASIYRSDIALMVSSYEMEILQHELEIPKPLLFHLPLMFNELDDASISKWPKHEDRKDFVCIGNGKHAPNVDSIQLLKSKIWPMIREQLPEANLFVYGAYLPQQIEEMHHPKQGFHIMGWAEDIEAVLRNARILLAPLQFGAGIKGKLLDAMRCGTPSVTTSIGAEGMCDNVPWNGSICDDWVAFSGAAVELHQKEPHWKKAQEHGIAIINNFYNKNILQTALAQEIEAKKQHLKTHRFHNFIGRMLQQHTLSSTKYMAKWIEEKNRG